MPKKDRQKPFSELVRQIEAYGLKDKLADLVHKETARRPFRHLPKQFSKGILIGNIAIVPKKHTGTRYVYVIADMLEAKIIYEDINLKQTAILVAHHLSMIDVFFPRNAKFDKIMKASIKANKDKSPEERLITKLQLYMIL